MRILVLCKRQYTGKDLLDDRYGRLFELPAGLAARGHDVRGIAVSYARRSEGEFGGDGAGVRWWSANALPGGPIGFLHAYKAATQRWRPDVIWASSDAVHAILARYVARRERVPYVFDLYDNYESFGLTRVPGLRRGLRSACRAAAGLTVVTQALRDHVRKEYRELGPSTVIGNGVDPSHFYPRHRDGARQQLRLPLAAKLIGTAGSITQDRGIDDLFRAFAALAEQDENVWLAYAGPRDSTPRQYRLDRVVDLGSLPHRQIPEFLSALDVAVVCNRDSAFGRFCYPMKLEEALACGTPVVAAGVGDVVARLSHDVSRLYSPGNHIELAAKLAATLSAGRERQAVPTSTWTGLAATLDLALADAVASRIGAR